MTRWTLCGLIAGSTVRQSPAMIETGGSSPTSTSCDSERVLRDRSGALALWRSGALALWRSGALACPHHIDSTNRSPERCA